MNLPGCTGYSAGFTAQSSVEAVHRRESKVGSTFGGGVGYLGLIQCFWP